MDGSISCDGTFALVAQKLFPSTELNLYRLFGITVAGPILLAR